LALKATHYQFPGQQSFYKGKVRDVYDIGDQFVSIASDRISAFDHVLPRAIPYKGQVLNQIAAHFLKASRDIVPNWLEATPDPNVSIGHRCAPIMIEMVIRGYLAGHAWREYKAGKRTICGVSMPDGMREGDAFPTPIITPATKAEEGHDEDISREDILSKHIALPAIYEQMEDYTYKLFALGQEMAQERGLILVDTKYEFGIYQGRVTLMDEVHTPDSLRYYYLNGYEERQRDGKPQEQLSKEFVREWLMDHDFQGKDGQTMPEMPDAFVTKVSDRYIQLYELITGKSFERRSYERIEEVIYDSVVGYVGEG
jgi:phosphoribosylaminoimidazole-succinocarboxamide synthase